MHNPLECVVYWVLHLFVCLFQVDENFIAHYQANYGVGTTDSQENTAEGQKEAQKTSVTVPSTTSDENSFSKDGDSVSHDPKAQEGLTNQEGDQKQGEEQQPQAKPMYRYQKMQMKRKAEQSSEYKCLSIFIW